MAIQTLTLPLAKGVYKNVDGVELSDYDYRLVDCYVDEMGYARKRPGLSSFQDVSSLSGASNYPVNGIYWWKNPSLGIIVSHGKVIKFTYSSGYSTFTDITSSTIGLSSVPSFTTDGTYLFVCNGGKIVYTNGTVSTAELISAGCPVANTHVDWLDGYVLSCGDGTNRFYWSDVNNSLSWNALNYASAAGDADPITALKVYQRMIFLFGPKSLEVWENDGVTPFIRSAAGFYNIGTSAPHSVVIGDQALYWLSDTRRIVRYVSGSIEAASTPYDKELLQFSSVSDCRAFRSVIDGKAFLIFTFPTAERTLVFSEADNRWHEWGYWNLSVGERERWLGECVCWFPDWNLHLVGDRSRSLVYSMSPDIYNDNGNLIRFERITGHLDGGTRKTKRSEEVRFRCKRGVGGISRDPKMSVRWKTDNKQWSNEKLLSLGAEGETDILLRLKRCGIFRTKQYEIVVTDDVPVAIGDGEEDVTILR